MHIPRDFSRKLDKMFGGRLRIRWSNQAGAYHIEQKVGRGVLPTFHFDDQWDDNAIRQRDGYLIVMAIRPGDRMPCPQCGLTIKVPVMQFGEAVCEYCRVKGYEGRHVASYWPLGDSLLDHLRKIDPYLGWREQVHKDIDRRNAAKEAAQQRHIGNITEAVSKEHFNRLVGIPSVGYTGRERYHA